jgi:HEAT repeat protein
VVDRYSSRPIRLLGARVKAGKVSSSRVVGSKVDVVSKLAKTEEADSPPVRIVIAVCSAILLNVFGPTMTSANPLAWQHDLAVVRELTAELRKPLTWFERHPRFGFLAHLTSVDGEPHITAIETLKVIGRPAAVFALIEVLQDPEFPYRGRVAAALAETPHPSSVPPLMDALLDPDARLRRMAARALGRVVLLTDPNDVAREAVARILIESIKNDPEPAVRVAAFHAVINLNSETYLFEAFEYAANDSHRLMRCGLKPAAAYIAMHAEKPALTRLASRIAWNDLNPQVLPDTLGVLVRAHYRRKYFSIVDQVSDCVDVSLATLESLAYVQNKTVIPILLKAARARDPGLRSTAIEGLARYMDDETLEAVAEALDDPIWSVRWEAIRGLADSENPRAVEHLASVFQYGALSDRKSVATILGEPVSSDDSGVDHKFKDARSGVDLNAGQSMPRRGIMARENPAVLDALVRAFADKAAPVRREAELALLEKPRIAEEALIEALASEMAHARIRAARMLAGYDSVKSRTLLLLALHSNRPPQNEAAALALGLRGDLSVRVDLERAALRDDVALRIAAIQALQDLRQVESLPVLRGIVADEVHDGVRTAAEFAIARIDAKTRIE